MPVSCCCPVVLLTEFRGHTSSSHETSYTVQASIETMYGA
ncbi:MAG: hypothetical protein ACI8XD_001783, partial [Thermoproteota archaeon]